MLFDAVFTAVSHVRQGLASQQQPIAIMDAFCSLPDVCTAVQSQVHVQLARCTTALEADRAPAPPPVEAFPPLRSGMPSAVGRAGEGPPSSAPTFELDARVQDLAVVYAALVASVWLPSADSVPLLLRLLQAGTAATCAVTYGKQAVSSSWGSGLGGTAGGGYLASSSSFVDGCPPAFSSPSLSSSVRQLDVSLPWSPQQCVLFARTALTTLLPWLSHLPQRWAGILAKALAIFLPATTGTDPAPPADAAAAHTTDASRASDRIVRIAGGPAGVHVATAALQHVALRGERASWVLSISAPSVSTSPSTADGTASVRMQRASDAVLFAGPMDCPESPMSTQHAGLVAVDPDRLEDAAVKREADVVSSSFVLPFWANLPLQEGAGKGTMPQAAKAGANRSKALDALVNLLNEVRASPPCLCTQAHSAIHARTYTHKHKHKPHSLA
jgi:hypothetical protein